LTLKKDKSVRGKSKGKGELTQGRKVRKAKPASGEKSFFCPQIVLISTE